METRRRTNTKVLSGRFAAVVTIAMLGVLFSSAAHASGADVSLSPMAGALNASGEAEIEFVGSVMTGSVSVEGLPPQAFGTGRFYGVWFVRTDQPPASQDKAFLGALVGEDSIIFSAGGEGATNFAATKFTTGPDKGNPITLGLAGNNLIIVLIENNINGLYPSPVGPVPGTGAAVAGSF